MKVVLDISKHIKEAKLVIGRMQEEVFLRNANTNERFSSKYIVEGNNHIWLPIAMEDDVSKFVVNLEEGIASFEGNRNALRGERGYFGILKRCRVIEYETVSPQQKWYEVVNPLVKAMNDWIVQSEDFGASSVDLTKDIEPQLLAAFPRYERNIVIGLFNQELHRRIETLTELLHTYSKIRPITI